MKKIKLYMLKFCLLVLVLMSCSINDTGYQKVLDQNDLSKSCQEFIDIYGLSEFDYWKLLTYIDGIQDLKTLNGIKISDLLEFCRDEQKANSRQNEGFNMIPNSLEYSITKIFEGGRFGPEYLDISVNITNTTDVDVKFDQYSIAFLNPLNDELFQSNYNVPSYWTDSVIVVPSHEQVRFETGVKMEYLSEELDDNRKKTFENCPKGYLNSLGIEMRGLRFNNVVLN